MLAGLALAILAAAPRLFNLLALDPFVDEITWMHWAVDLADSPDRPTRLWLPIVLNGRPPLYYWLTLLMTGLVDNAFIAGRLAAALPDIGSTVALYALGRVLLSARVGILAGLLWALSPFSIFFSRLASDDALLTFGAILVALSSVVLVRYPRAPSGALCGFSIGLAVMAKTLGLLTLAYPVLAVLVLARPGTWATLIRPTLVGVLVAGLVLSPLVPWLPRLAEMAAIHANVSVGPSSSEDAVGGVLPAGLSRALLVELLRVNLDHSIKWLAQYVGLPTLALAGLGLMLGPLRRQRALIYLVLIWAIPFVVTIDRTQLFFSRYLLFTAFPLYVLAAAAIVWLADVGSRWGPYQTARRIALLGGGLALAMGPGLPFTFELITTPERAPLPSEDRYQHIEQWYALYGVGRIADYLEQQARLGPVTVLVPPSLFWQELILPRDVLRLYLRGQPAIRFVELSALQEETPGSWEQPESFCELRGWLHAETPTFYAINGMHALPGPPPLVPLYTRRMEVAQARDLPEAQLVLHIPRPGGPSWMGPRWLDLYRIDQPAAADGGHSLSLGEKRRASAGADEDCRAISRLYGAGWYPSDPIPGAFYELGSAFQLRRMAGQAEYAEGPLPEGWYRPLVWGKTMGERTALSFRLDGVELGQALASPEQDWAWLDAPGAAWVPAGATARLELQTSAAPPVGGPNSQAQGQPQLAVQRIYLFRDPSANGR